MIFSINQGPSNYLNVVATTNGVNLQGPNPDLTVFTQFLSYDQARQIANGAGRYVATGNINVTVAGVQVIAYPVMGSASEAALLSSLFGPQPTFGINIVVPLSGGFSGQTFTQSLTSDQAQQFSKALGLYLATYQ